MCNELYWIIPAVVASTLMIIYTFKSFKEEYTFAVAIFASLVFPVSFFIVLYTDLNAFSYKRNQEKQKLRSSLEGIEKNKYTYELVKPNSTWDCYHSYVSPLKDASIPDLYKRLFDLENKINPTKKKKK